MPTIGEIKWYVPLGVVPNDDPEAPIEYQPIGAPRSTFGDLPPDSLEVEAPAPLDPAPAWEITTPGGVTYHLSGDYARDDLGEPYVPEGHTIVGLAETPEIPGGA
jgi:hypothetical protein